MRTIAVLAVVVAAGGSPARVASSVDRPVSQEPSSIAELVRLYRSGLQEAAVAAAARWRTARITLEVDRLIAEEASRLKMAEREARVLPSLDVVGLEGERSLEAAQEREAMRLAAAAIFAERALCRLRHGDQERLAPGLQAASRLVELKPPGEAGRSFARCFYLLAGLVLHDHVEIAEGYRLLARALQDYPNDPELHTALGSTIEAVASLRQYELAPGTTAATRNSGGYASEGGAFGGRLPEASLARALAHYERALSLDPGLDEARLRLAHVRLVSGRAGQALADLERVAAEARQPRQRYLARLFAGAARERLGDLDGAATEYRACVAAGPRAQTALLALGRSLQRLGDRAGAQEAFERASARSVPFDPWWSYQAGQPERFDDLVARLRGLVP